MAELVFAVDVLNRVVLVDDVDEMARFGDTPEDLVDADHEVPVVADMQPVGLAHIGVGSRRLRPSNRDMRFFAADEIAGIYTDHSSRI